MRLFAVLSLLTLSAKAEFPTKEFIETIKPAVEKCESSTGVDKGLVDQFSKGIMVDDDKLKLDETTGYFRYEKMLSMIPQEMRSIAYDMGRNCIHFKGEGGADLCQVSFDLHRCWQQTDPEVSPVHVKLSLHDNNISILTSCLACDKGICAII